MAVLLLAEHTNDALNGATGKALSAALDLGSDVHVLVAGKDCRPAAEEAAKLTGVAKVLVADAAHLEHQVAEDVAALIVPMMANYDALVAPATARGKNTLPRIAALLDVMQI
ncbi:MAG: electron transfer flavoprotein subunit alpha/FixB family protein, partial [Pseudomonadota bacterium]